jgi:hypothetical protein
MYLTFPEFKDFFCRVVINHYSGLRDEEWIMRPSKLQENEPENSSSL